MKFKVGARVQAIGKDSACYKYGECGIVKEHKGAYYTVYFEKASSTRWGDGRHTCHVAEHNLILVDEQSLDWILELI